MRWILWIILAYLALAVQNALGILIGIHTSWLGDIRPDILAAAAVFVVLTVRNLHDVIIACWLLGLGLDLTSGQGVVGPMALAYSGAAFVVFRVRDAFFRDRLSSQIIMTAIFALMAHVAWITLQLVLALRSAHWESLGRLLLQACVLTLYSGLLAPMVFALLGRCSRWLIAPAAGRGSRER
jgi:cell shape-determining protein MreD